LAKRVFEIAQLGDEILLDLAFCGCHWQGGVVIISRILPSLLRVKAPVLTRALLGNHQMSLMV